MNPISAVVFTHKEPTESAEVLRVRMTNEKREMGQDTTYHSEKHLLMLCVVSTANPEERGYVTEISSSVFRGTDFEHMLISLSSFLKVSICLRALMNHSCSNRNSYHH